MGSTSCRTELVSLRPKISPTPFFCHNGIGAPTSRKAVHPRNTQPVSFRRTIGDRRAADAWARHYFVPLGPLVSSPSFFWLARPPAVAKQLIIKVSCLLPHFPLTRIHSLSHSLSLAEKLLNSCCHARQRTVLKVAEPLLSRSSENRAFHSDSGKCRLLQLSLQHICQNCSAAICVSLLSLVSDSHSFGLFLPFLGCFCTASCRFSLCTWRMLAFA